MPAVYNVPSLGNIMALMFILFAGWNIGAAVSVLDYPLLVDAGLASMFAGLLMAIPFLLDLFRLPHDLSQVFLTVDVIGRRFSTLVPVMGMATTALIGPTAMQGRLCIRRRPLLRFVGTTAGILACALIGIRAFYSHFAIAPYTRDEPLRALHLLADPQSATVYRDIPADPAAAAPGSADIAQARVLGVLRACYIENEFPSSFFNAEGQLVGFNIEFMHRLARNLDLPIEFLPVKSEDKRDAAHLLVAGVCDLYASTMAVSAQRMEEFTMAIPIYTGSVGLNVPDHMRNDFPSWTAVRGKGLRFASLFPVIPRRSASRGRCCRTQRCSRSQRSSRSAGSSRPRRRKLMPS